MQQRKKMHVYKVVLFTIVAALLTIFAMGSTSYSSIYSFGDSWADTGSSYYFYKVQNITSYSLKYPYGETYFGNPTGRFSDGRLIIDFIAEYLRLPFVKPYLSIDTNTNIQEGVNFGIAGATALDPSFFEKRKIPFPRGYCLRNQLDWFRNSLPSLCASSSNCIHDFRNSLFLMGEIGGNDYLLGIAARTTREELTSTFLPKVINAITSAVKELINLGAVTILVPGTIPIGCNSIILTIHEGTPMKEYDKYGCIKWLNKFAEQHNEQLQIELHNLQMLYSDVNIFYGDYYNILLKLVHTPTKFGFEEGLVPLKCCCGGGGRYEYNMSAPCGDRRAKVCDDPSRYVNWDGPHLTEAAYKWIAKSLLSKEPFTTVLETSDTIYLSG